MLGDELFFGSKNYSKLIGDTYLCLSKTLGVNQIVYAEVDANCNAFLFMIRCRGQNTLFLGNIL